MRSLATCLALAIVLGPIPAEAQIPGPTGVTVTGTTVTRVTLLDVKQGERPAFDRDMVDNLIPIWEEYKKAGILTDYAIFNNVTTDHPGDWEVGFALTYPNYATFDNLPARTNPITLRHYGTAERRTAAGQARTGRATTVSSRLLRGIRYSK